MSTDLTGLLLKPGRTIRSRTQKDLPAEWYLSPTYCVLVDMPEGRLLWDTCCPRDWEMRWPASAQDFCPYDSVGEDEYFESRLAQLHLEPSDIDWVVMSHLHADHAGNVRMLANAGAKVICSAAELDFATAFPGEFYGAHLKGDYEGLKFETVSEDGEILPNVSLIHLPGHTPGTLAMKLDLRETGTVIFTSDAVYMGDSYGPPVAPPAIVDDLGSWYASVEKLRTLAEQSDAQLVFGHDSDQMRSLLLAPDGYYE
jgi:glyoxylase-like metal-dependent hydrolase (beta-lactamase superfamily II)